MTHRIVKRDRVIDDLIEQARYISQDNTEAAERFLIAAEKSFARLANMPRLGSKCHLSHPTLQELRKWAIEGFENHLIFYFAHEATIEIVRILYGSRQWNVLLEEKN